MQQIVVFDTDLRQVLEAIHTGDITAAAEQLRELLECAPLVPPEALDYIAAVEEELDDPPEPD